MSEWRRRWEITFTWRREVSGGRVLSTRVDTPAQLRAVVEWARGHPDVIAYRQRSVRELLGERPAACGRGHPYSIAGAAKIRFDWLPRTCGGHALYRCRTFGCGDVRADPAIEPDCQPRHERSDNAPLRLMHAL